MHFLLSSLSGLTFSPQQVTDQKYSKVVFIDENGILFFGLDAHKKITFLMLIEYQNKKKKTSWGDYCLDLSSPNKCDSSTLSLNLRQFGKGG